MWLVRELRWGRRRGTAPRRGSPGARLQPLVAFALGLAVAACYAVPGMNRGGGTTPSFTVPAERLERRPARLPAGVALRGTQDYEATDDLLVGDLALPSGRIIVGEFLFDAEPLEIAVAPGSYPVHATLARFRGQTFDGVALATLTLADAGPVRWTDGGSFAVDGGTAVITSVETRDYLTEVFEASDADWLALHEAIFASLEANEGLATLVGFEQERDLAEFSSGNGDGVYPVYIGFDAQDRPTSVVLDFFLLELAWPGA